MEEEEGAIGCMSCMKTDDLCDLFAVHGHNSDTYTMMFETCFNMKISNELRYICKVCATKLENANEFKEQTMLTINMLLGVRDEEYLDESLLEEEDGRVKDNNAVERKKAGPAVVDIDAANSVKNFGSRRTGHNTAPSSDILHCDLCSVLLNNSAALSEHLERNHGVKRSVEGKQYSCHFCDNVYSGRKACYTHVRMKHGLKLSSESTPKPTRRERKYCHICRKDFSQKQILNKHLWKEHGYEVEKRKAYICPLCDERVSYGSHFERHLLLEHRFKQRVCTLEFKDMEEFNIYKNQIQEETKCRFRKTTASKPTIEGLRSHYMCSQSGMYVYQGKGIRPAPERQIYKTGKACPAHMVVTQTVEQVQVTFYMTHVGHGACPYYVPRSPKKPCKLELEASLLKSLGAALTGGRDATSQHPSPDTLLKQEVMEGDACELDRSEWICDTCGVRFKNEMTFRQHTPSHSHKLYPCQQCDMMSEALAKGITLGVTVIAAGLVALFVWLEQRRIPQPHAAHGRPSQRGQR